MPRNKSRDDPLDPASPDPEITQSVALTRAGELAKHPLVTGGAQLTYEQEDESVPFSRNSRIETRGIRANKDKTITIAFGGQELYDLMKLLRDLAIQSTNYDLV